MTLQDFFDLVSRHPIMTLIVFLAFPLTAFLANILGRGEGHLSPWKYLYSVLVYAVSIPGIFAVVLCIYLFLFERQPILETNIYTQILPIVIMVVTLLLIKRNVPFDLIPGFEKLSALLVILFCLIALMWLLDRTHIIAITLIPFHYLVLFVIVMVAIIILALRRFAKQ